MADPSKSESREALGTFGEAARAKDKLPKADVTEDNRFRSGELNAEEKNAADILGGNAAGDKARVDGAIRREAKTDKRSGA